MNKYFLFFEEHKLALSNNGSTCQEVNWSKPQIYLFTIHNGQNFDEIHFHKIYHRDTNNNN